MEPRLRILLNISAELLHEAKVRPLYRGKLPKGLTAKGLRLLELQEANRVIKLLKQARALLDEVDTVLVSSNDAETVGRAAARAIDTMQALLRAVTA